jgi:Plavaka transposase
MSFKTAKALRDLAEMLPSGPMWKFKEWPTSYPTKHPVTLYYRDPIDCLQSILSNPYFKDSLDFTPLRVFKTSEKLVRCYTEWLTGDATWKMQV